MYTYFEFLCVHFQYKSYQQMILGGQLHITHTIRLFICATNQEFEECLIAVTKPGNLKEHHNRNHF